MLRARSLAKWTRRGPDSIFPVDIRITGENQSGILNSISEAISKDLKVNINAISMESEQGIIIGKISLRVRDLGHLESLIERLKKIKGIYTVSRLEGST